MAQNNIVLIGMPGVGKSTLGVILAKVLGYSFIDTDILIQEKEGKLLSDIIDENGVEYFLKVEDDVNSKLNVNNSIIATGGSVVYGNNAMDNLKKIGKVVYLKQDFDHINKRVENIHGRGVVLKGNQTFKELYDERIKLYEKYSDITIEQGDLEIEETLKLLIEALKKE